MNARNYGTQTLIELHNFRKQVSNQLKTLTDETDFGIAAIMEFNKDRIECCFFRQKSVEFTVSVCHVS